MTPPTPITPEQRHQLAIAPLPQFNIIKSGSFHVNYGPYEVVQTSDYKLVTGEYFWSIMKQNG